MFTRLRRTIVVPFLLCFVCCFLMAAGSDELSPRSIVGTSDAVALMVGGDRHDDCRSDSNDDDVVARQLRAAAESEQDPVLKEKLWDEYRKYKASKN